MRDIFYILILVCLLAFIFMRPVKEDAAFDRGFNEGIEQVGRTVARLQDRYDSIKAASDTAIKFQIIYQTKIKLKYDTIYIGIDTISFDSSVNLRTKLRSQFRGFYRN